MKRCWITGAGAALLAGAVWANFDISTSMVPTGRCSTAWAASPEQDVVPAATTFSSRRHAGNQVIQTSSTKLDEQFEEFSLSLPDDAPETFSEQVHVAPPTPRPELTPAATATNRDPQAATSASPDPARIQPAPDSAPLRPMPAVADVANESQETGGSASTPVVAEPMPRHAHQAETAAPRYAQPAAPRTLTPTPSQEPSAAARYAESPTPAVSTPARVVEPLKAEAFPTSGVVAAVARPVGQDSSREVVSVNWVTPKEVNRGETVTCDLQVTNAGELPAMAVEVHVKLPDNVTLADADQTPDVDGRLLTWRVGRLESHETKTFRLGLQSQAEGNLAPMAAVTFTHAATARIQVNDPQLSVVIEGPEQTVVAQPATYHVHVSNPGTGHVRNVVLQTRIDGQLFHSQGSQAEYAVGTLGPGQSRRLELPLTALEPGDGAIAVVASAAGSLEAHDEHALVAVRPTVDATLDGPSRRFVGRPAVYTVSIHNPTPATANNVQVFGGVPEGFRFVGSSDGGSFDEGQGIVAWFVGRLEPQETRQVTFELDAVEPGDHQVAAAVRADAGVEEQLTTQTRVEGVASVVLEVIDADDPVEASGQTAYQIRVSNHGSKAASSVQVAAIVPAEMEALRIGGPAEGTISGDRIVFEPLPRLLPGETQVFEVLVQCRESGTARFRAFLRTDEQTEPIQQDEVTRVYQD